jgi:hypothetical protein
LLHHVKHLCGFTSVIGDIPFFFATSPIYKVYFQLLPGVGFKNSPLSYFVLHPLLLKQAVGGSSPHIDIYKVNKRISLCLLLKLFFIILKEHY